MRADATHLKSRRVRPQQLDLLLECQPARRLFGEIGAGVGFLGAIEMVSPLPEDDDVSFPNVAGGLNLRQRDRLVRLLVPKV